MTVQATPKIAIIGAGAAGLALAKQVIDAFRTSARAEMKLVIFEAKDDVGGIWSVTRSLSLRSRAKTLHTCSCQA